MPNETKHGFRMNPIIQIGEFLKNSQDIAIMPNETKHGFRMNQIIQIREFMKNSQDIAVMPNWKPNMVSRIYS